METLERQRAKWKQMPIGNGHHWRYDNCEVQEWKQSEIEWDFEMSATKNRVGGWNRGRYWKAIPGRAMTDREAPLGARYTWLHMWAQDVVKIGPDSYSIHSFGPKLRLSPCTEEQRMKVAARITEIATNVIEHSCTTPEKMAREYVRLRESAKQSRLESF